jgi:hypothetical protein
MTLGKSGPQWPLTVMMMLQSIAIHQFSTNSMSYLKQSYHSGVRPLEKAIGAAREPPQRPKCSTTGHPERLQQQKLVLTRYSSGSK